MTRAVVPQPTTDSPAASADVCYRWRLLQAGPLRLDGGSMFGVVPRVLWSKLTPPDEEGRIRLAHNCLFLEPAQNDEVHPPSPGTPGEDGGEGDLENQVLATPAHRVRQGTLTPPLSR